MEINRPQYLNQLIKKMHNGRVKIVTGIRRCGKSYLLFDLFVKYLRERGVCDEQIITLALDEIGNLPYRNPFALDAYIRGKMTDATKQYYVMIDEIQFVSLVPNPYDKDSNVEIGFADVLLGLIKIPNADVYVTGSNSKMLSSDILTQFRDRGDEIRVYPLSYAEFFSVYTGKPQNAWREYYTYGGMPLTLSLDTHEEKSKYLKDLFTKTYLRDVVERHDVRHETEILGDLLNVVSSSIGSLTNPNKLSNTFVTEKQIRVTSGTIETYLDYFQDAFLLEKSQRYDVKGKKYLKTPVKYYFTDIGLRNARLNFRQQEEPHIMENIIYNDLVRRGFDVDVGVIEKNVRDENDKRIRKQLEVDFVVNRGSQRYYIQSALSIEDPEKRKQETSSLCLIPDSFKKVVIVKDNVEPWRDENGILYIGVEQFLLEEEALIVL